VPAGIGSGHGAIEVITNLQKPFSLRTLAPKIREVLDADVAALAAPPSV
jgi:hypothetical protein